MRRFLLALALLAAVELQPRAYAKTYLEGAGPSNALVQGPDGSIYGTTQWGGGATRCGLSEGQRPIGCGTVFRIDPAGVVTNLHRFSGGAGGANPTGLGVAWDGTIYGVTLGDGPRRADPSAIAYSLSPTGSFVGRAQLRDGVWGDLLSLGRRFYGVTSTGWLFAFAPPGSISYRGSIQAISGAGSNPEPGLALGSDMALYSGTSAGGPANQGCFYRVGSNATVTSIYCFASSDPNGGVPLGGLTAGADGNLYGTTSVGGALGGGTIIRLATGGAMTKLADLGPPGPSNPIAGLALADDGNFYGLDSSGGANHGGTLFRVTPTGTVSVVVNFCKPVAVPGGSFCGNGQSPQGRLLKARDGTLWGTTLGGGTLPGATQSPGYGTVFRYDPQVQEFTTSVVFTGE